MGIGILTISLTPRSDQELVGEEGIATVDGDTVVSQAPIYVSLTPSVTPELTQVPSPTVSPTPTPLPVYPLEETGYPKIESLIKAYYEAKIYCDTTKLKTMLSDPDDVPSLDQLQKDIMYIEEYRSIKCYVKKSYEDNAYIVYVYYEIKFVNIDTPAPAVDRSYLITDDTGDIKIYSKQLDGEAKEYYDARLYDADVQKLLKEVNAKGKAAMAKDELLKSFWEGMMSTQDEEGETDSDE
jgi:hypothetical protein